MSFKSQLKKIVLLLKNEQIEKKHNHFEHIIKVYENLLQDLLKAEFFQMEAIKNNSIIGSSKAFLQVDSDYLHPILFEMGTAENMERELFDSISSKEES